MNCPFDVIRCCVAVVSLSHADVRVLDDDDDAYFGVDLDADYGRWRPNRLANSQSVVRKKSYFQLLGATAHVSARRRPRRRVLSLFN